MNISTYSNRLILDLLNIESNDSEALMAEIDNRGGIAAVEAARYAPIGKAHDTACVSRTGEDCCSAYAYGTEALYIDL